VANIYKSEAGRQAVERSYLDALQRWPVANRQLRIPTCQGDTFVIVSGEEHAPPVVLFHGSGTNSSMWMADITAWARQYRVYAVDMIGEPGLSAPSRPPLQSDAYTLWLDDVWNHLGLTKASVVGISLGGWLALEYAVKRPDRVASLTLLSPSGVGAQNSCTLIKAGVLLALGPWGLRRALRLVTGRASLPREAAEALMLRFQHFRPRMERLPIRTDEELASLQMPVRLILGAHDSLIRSQETRDRMAGRVPRLRLTYLEDAGHILPRQTEAIAQFLGGVAA
jgi:pimeloyl-ACP methyl ester carboxylesterase